MDKKAKVEGGFKLVVDGVEYGPFREKYRAQYSDLAHRKGVSFLPVRLASGWLEPIPPPKRTKKDNDLPLLGGIGFTAKPKIGRQF